MNIRGAIKEGIRVMMKRIIELNTNWLVNVSTKFTVGFVVFSFILLFLNWNILPPWVPLWYSRPWGTDRLAHPIYLFILPVASLFWHVTNTLISVMLVREYLVFCQVLAISSLIISILSFITLLSICMIIR